MPRMTDRRARSCGSGSRPNRLPTRASVALYVPTPAREEKKGGVLASSLPRLSFLASPCPFTAHRREVDHMLDSYRLAKFRRHGRRG